MIVLEFSEWSDWSACSVTCDDGERTRSRTCTAGCHNVDDNDTNHSLSQTEQCINNLQWCGEYQIKKKLKLSSIITHIENIY